MSVKITFPIADKMTLWNYEWHYMANSLMHATTKKNTISSDIYLDSMAINTTKLPTD